LFFEVFTEDVVLTPLILTFRVYLPPLAALLVVFVAAEDVFDILGLL
jgi:hypothetical protein